MFRLGTIVEVIVIFSSSKYDIGCIAKVVNGRNKFPKLYAELRNKVSDADFEEFIWVMWNKKDKRWKGAQDGAYMGAAFQEVNEYFYNFDEDEETTQKIVITAPKNNDGRVECFWCGTNTIRKMGLINTYDICPKCKK